MSGAAPLPGAAAGAGLAIIAGSGRLPQLLAGALPGALWVTLTGIDAPAGTAVLAARFERLGALFTSLRAGGITRVVFAGAIRRPAVDPAQLDAFALALARHFAGGDDAVLRQVAALFEAQGFEVLAPAALVPGLSLAPGTQWGAGYDAQAGADAARAAAVLAALAPLDVGQGAVVAGGLVLGIETIQGTEAMLDFVGRTDPALRRARGVFVKAPKAGQELRLDSPAVGPETAAQLSRAGLAGMVIHPGVLVIDADELRAGIEAAGLFLAQL